MFWLKAFGVLLISAMAFHDALAQEAELDDAATQPEYCGVAAVELVARRLGNHQLIGSEYERLRQLPISSFLDLRRGFEGNGFEAKTYELKSGDAESWKWLGDLLKCGVAQIIFRLDNPKDNQMWHFVVASDALSDQILLIDPSTMSETSVDREQLFTNRSTLQIQVVTHKKSNWVCWPLRTDELLCLSVLPVVTLLTLVRSKMRKRAYASQ